MPAAIDRVLQVKTIPTILVARPTAGRPGKSGKGFSGILLCFLILLISSCGINNIPIFEQAVNDAWIEVQTHYRKRAELVMQLLDQVQPLSQSESDLIERITAAETLVFEMHIAPDTLEDERAFIEFQQRQETLSTTLQELLETSQNYPEVSESEEFSELVGELAENRKLIDVARRDYWQMVERYNSELVNVPGRWWRAFVYPKAVTKENFPEPTEERNLSGAET